ncbi:hypothetical protein AMATHDRAFT_1651 [Amanita thiersii Skay4041]|uniref:Methyltransferase domain-containing protein n=1 Tax=Amanita thiersii Skay4041 TaxID=703135 RepID=A0A2A9NYF2_9AGAR|nr:hypothetical protein AMATHDRAFT_1651 [Amanita thiersii Skay4041]
MSTSQQHNTTDTDTKQEFNLDVTLLSLDSEESEFFKSQTGIVDDEELRKHILDIQMRAYKVYPYPCIYRFSFTRLKISRLPAYKSVLNLKHERSNPIFLDIGCCFGNDIRKIVADGWPIQNVIASDLRTEFWDCGHDLFKSKTATFPAAFVPGDAFDPNMISPRAPLYETPQTPCPDLKSLKSLNPLQGHISAIHASSFFHLFNEEKQLELARKLATLLSPASGSVIFGSHVGKLVKGIRSIAPRGSTVSMFCHSPDSWRDVWNGQVFAKDTIHVEAGLKEIDRDIGFGVEEEVWILYWSIKRL